MPKIGSVVNNTDHMMPKDYLHLTKYDRMKLLNVQKGKKTKRASHNGRPSPGDCFTQILATNEDF